jgi:hypothetical protein
MHFIRLTNRSDKNCQEYIKVEDIKVIKGYKNSTEIFLYNMTAFNVRETPQEIFQLMQEALGEKEAVYVHEGLYSNRLPSKPITSENRVVRG